MDGLPARRIGRDGPAVGAIGLGTMGMSAGYYGPSDDAANVTTIRRAVEIGVTLIDTADVYGDGHNESLVGRALAGRRERVVLATKVGLVSGPAGPGVDARPERMRPALEASLRRLGVERVDLWYLHRVDPTVPVEETVGAMGDLVRAGLADRIGLSEVGPGTLRRAHAAHPISAVQSELSIWNRDPLERVLPALREIGATLVAFSPLGRGFLAGAAALTTPLADDDMRSQMPRFGGANLDRNRPILERVRHVATRHGVTPAQVALAWVLDRGPDVVPIPGTRRIVNLESNAAAAGLVLDDDDRALLDDPGLVPAGARYPQGLMDLLDPEVRSS